MFFVLNSMSTYEIFILGAIIYFIFHVNKRRKHNNNNRDMYRNYNNYVCIICGGSGKIEGIFEVIFSNIFLMLSVYLVISFISLILFNLRPGYRTF